MFGIFKDIYNRKNKTIPYLKLLIIEIFLFSGQIIDYASEIISSKDTIKKKDI